MSLENQFLNEVRQHVAGLTNRDDAIILDAATGAGETTLQIAEAMNGGKTKFITTIEGSKVALYGDVAVASFVRIFTVYPHNQPVVQGGPVWVTLVLVKEGGEWGIAHTHSSQAGGNN